MAPRFVHLRLHSEYSVVDGITRLSGAVKKAAADQQPALALTDLGNTFGAVKFYREARAAGVQPILGADIACRVPGAAVGGPAAQVPRLLFLAQNAVGYKNLCRLLARAWLEGTEQGRGEIHLGWLSESSPDGVPLHEGLLVLSGGALGPMGQALARRTEAGMAEAESLARQLQALLGNRFYIEVQRVGAEGEEHVVRASLELASRLGIAPVATHPIQFLEPEDFRAHEARVCIADGELLANPKRHRRFTAEQSMLSQADMVARFADVPEAVANTLAIARRCSLELQLGKPQLPHFPTPNGESLDEFLRAESARGLAQRLEQCFPDPAVREAKRPDYEARLQLECDTIINMGFPGYFLIVADFINWAKRNGVPVGPGRGSGAGSLVAFSLGITDLDPLPYALLFERFLNPERVSMPDFDIDFCQEGRQRVIEYVRSRYGRDAVSQIVTFGTMASRAVIRDAGRVLELSYNFCDQISKLIPVVQNKPLSLDEAREKEPVLASREEKEDDVRELLALARPLEDLTRNIGMHAGGVLIAPGQLTDFCPLYQAPDADGQEGVVSMYDKDDVEAVGLVKFDFLGLRNLTIIDNALRLINATDPARQGTPLTLEQLSGFNDPAAYEVLKTANTTAIFQVESSGMKRYLLKLQPDQFEDIIAMLALYRPGPLNSGMVDDFILRKRGQQAIDYFHPDLQACLAPTYGVIVYQEQVMQIAQIIAGYTLGGADLLRRAMGKKKPEEMAQQRSIFLAGAKKKGHTEALATQLFDLMEKFAEYGFNKSHTAAYAVITYQTAWLKAHYPAEFMAATLTADMGDTDKVAFLVADCRANRIEVLPPDIHHSVYGFMPVPGMRAIRYGLGAVRGVGQSAVEDILRARANAPGQRFADIFDFCARIDRRTVNKRALEALVRAGALDGLHPQGRAGRAQLLAGVGMATEAADQAEANAAQAGLFGEETSASAGLVLPDAKAFSLRECLLEEQLALGYCLSGSLFDAVAAEARRFAPTPLAKLVPGKEPQWIAGVVSGSRGQMTRRGMMRVVELDDGSGKLEVVVLDALYDSKRHLLKNNEVLLVQARIDNDEYSGGLRGTATEIQTLGERRSRMARALSLCLPDPPPSTWRETLARSIAEAKAAAANSIESQSAWMRKEKHPIWVSVVVQGHGVQVQLGPDHELPLADACIEVLRRAHGESAVSIVYSGAALDTARP